MFYYFPGGNSGLSLYCSSIRKYPIYPVKRQVISQRPVILMKNPQTRGFFIFFECMTIEEGLNWFIIPAKNYKH
jgi:hypothetical protein